MTGTESFIARAALGVFAAGASVVGVSLERFKRGSEQFFDRLATSIFVASRLSLFMFLFFVLRLQPRGDIPGFYFVEARAALLGYLPYRDFTSSYAPLHSYLDASVISIWRSPLAIILLVILIECFLLPIWLRLGRSFFSEERVRIAAILYIASPISLQYVSVDGQDNVIIAVLLGLGMLLLARRRALTSGVFVALGAVLVKFLPLLYFPAFFLATGRRLRWAAGALLVLLIGYGSFALKHLPILNPLLFEGQMRSASNLPYLVESLFNWTPPPHSEDGFLLLVLCILIGLIGRGVHQASPVVRMRVLTFGSAALTLTLLVLSKKSWPPYLMLTLFPICLLIFGDGPARKLRLAGFAFFGVIAVVAHSFWATFLSQFLAADFHAALVARSHAAFFFLVLQLLLIAGYLWLLYETIYQLLHVERLSHAEVPASPGLSSV
jgi:hypothetical protein